MANLRLVVMQQDTDPSNEVRILYDPDEELCQVKRFHSDGRTTYAEIATKHVRALFKRKGILKEIEATQPMTTAEALTELLTTKAGDSNEHQN
jgi:hypothetical protein